MVSDTISILTTRGPAATALVSVVVAAVAAVVVVGRTQPSGPHTSSVDAVVDILMVLMGVTGTIGFNAEIVRTIRWVCLRDRMIDTLYEKSTQTIIMLRLYEWSM
jgi:hypothetical protein